MNRNNNTRSISSLYRLYLRQIRLLPHGYLRLFFRLKARDDVETIRSAADDAYLFSRRYKRASKEIRKLSAANAGNEDAFSHVLDLAYGRKGRLRQEMLEPLLQDPRSPPADPIIAGIERSRPPSYSPELASLLTSSCARPVKPLKPDNLVTPPILPPQVDPSSEEARLLGPLSKRREVNLRWRYFTAQSKRVHVPLEVVIRVKDPSTKVWIESTNEDALKRAGIRGLTMQDMGLFQEVLNLSKSYGKSQLSEQGENKSRPQPNTSFNSSLPARFIRRRYRRLLGHLPILAYNYLGSSAESRDAERARYVVKLHPSALSPHIARSAKDVPFIDADDLAWIKLSNNEGKIMPQMVIPSNAEQEKSRRCNEITM